MRSGASRVRPLVHVYTPSGLTPYATSWRWQRDLLARRTATETDAERAALPHVLIALEHPPVFTLGRSARVSDLRFARGLEHGGEDDLPPPPPGFDVHRVERGGKVTYHGPGQLVCYPLLDLRAFKQDLHWYVHAIEAVAIAALASSSGLAACRAPGLPGVWVRDGTGGVVGGGVGGGGGGSGGVAAAAASIPCRDGSSPEEPAMRKIGAVGMCASKWFTQHGFAVNVAPDLTHFDHIVPCGIADRAVTSVARELELRADAGGTQAAPTVAGFLPHVLDAFEREFECDLIRHAPGEEPEL